MATLTLQDADDIASRRSPWTFRMEYRLPNAPASIPGEYLIVTGRAKHQPVEIHVGRIGAPKPNLIMVKDWNHVEQVVKDKLAKGWGYADTPFVPVRKQTIDAWQQGTLNLTPTVPAPGPVPAQVPPPVQTPPSSPQAVVVNGIAWIKPLPGGKFQALDVSGNVAGGLTMTEAQDLVQRSKVPIRWI